MGRVGFGLAIAMLLAGAGRADLGARLDLLAREDLRVATVFHRLATAGGDLCRRTGGQSGLVLHDRGQYGADARDEAARHFDLDDRAAVLAVVPGSAADRAGFRIGDRLVAINGVARSAAGTRAAMAAADAPVSITVTRAGRTVALSLAPAAGCTGRIELVPSTRLDARAGEGVIRIATALVEYAASDDELAFLIGHELAHVAIVPGKGRAAEAAADAAGLRLAARAGYDPAAAPAIVARLAKARGQGLRIDLDHPAVTDRVSALVRLAQSAAQERTTVR